MRIVIEFYRTRAQDDAHALLGRESAEVADLAAAIALAGDLARTFAETPALMPQRPDALVIRDAGGATLHELAFDDALLPPTERRSP
jgi:hypothetical protein